MYENYKKHFNMKSTMKMFQIWIFDENRFSFIWTPWANAKIKSFQYNLMMGKLQSIYSRIEYELMLESQANYSSEWPSFCHFNLITNITMLYVENYDITYAEHWVC